VIAAPFGDGASCCFRIYQFSLLTRYHLSVAMNLMHRAALVVILSSLPAIIGCSQSDTVAVTGTVTLNGKPTEQAEVMFNPKHGRLATGVTDASGHFTLSTAKPNDGAAPGEYVITLAEYYPPDKPPQLPRGGGLLPSRFPPKYADPAKSPLTATVERGKKNEFLFDVK